MTPGGAHLRLEVVRRDLRARDERRSSPGNGASRPPLKKYVTWAYFSVSATWNCRQPASDDRLRRASAPPRAGRRPRPAGRPRTRSSSRRGGPRGAGRPSGAARSKSSNAGLGQRVRQLAGAVGPEVAVDDRLAVARAAPSTPSIDRRPRRTRRSRRARRRPRWPRAPRARAPPPRGRSRRSPASVALPALVAIHGEVAAADRRDPGVRMGGGQARLEVAARSRAPSGAACRGRRAGRGRGRAGTPCAGRQLGERDEVPVVGVDAAGPDEADERAAGRSVATRPLAGLDERRALEERAVGDGGVDARQVLEHRPAGAEVQVADLGVAHLAGAAGRRPRPRPAGARAASARGAPRQAGMRRRGDRVRGRVVADAEAVEDDEDDGTRPGRRSGRRRRRAAGRRRGRRRAGARRSAPARATMPAISSGLSEAPPTSAPSMRGLGQELADAARR